MLAMLNQTASARDFTMFSSLPVVLLAVLGGITAPAGALLGGLILASFPVLAENVSWLSALALIGPGLIGVTLARQPDGLVLQLSDLWRGRRQPNAAPADAVPRHLEELGIDTAFEPAHVAAINKALAVEGV
jgi:hypothetical protein